MCEIAVHRMRENLCFIDDEKELLFLLVEGLEHGMQRVRGRRLGQVPDLGLERPFSAGDFRGGLDFLDGDTQFCHDGADTLRLERIDQRRQ
jgi:hypothetical protein